jgi:anthranilate synthase component 2
MGIEHKELPIYGVQFHPESILTPAGGRIIENVLSIATSKNRKFKA